MQSETIREPRLVVSIDFGTYASGFALQWRSDFKTNKQDIYCKQWEDGCFMTYKTLTCLLLNPKKSLENFGYSAEAQFCELDADAQMNYFFFRHYKMALHHINDVNEQTLIEDVNGKPLHIIDVFGASIEFMKEEVLEHLRNSGLGYFEEHTKWILTVPAIWDESAKQVMRSCAKKAGISGKYLSIALEPECAGLYCKQIPRDQLSLLVGGNTSKYVGDAGSTFMVVDMGGGTVDITTLKVNENGSMGQVYKSIGGPRAGQNVDDKFYKLIEDGIGRDNWRKFTQKFRSGELSLRRTFELEKRQVKHPMCESRRRGRTGTFKLRIPTEFMDFLKQCPDSQVISLLGNGCEYFKIIMSSFVFPIETTRSIFNETIEEMKKYIEEVVHNTRESGIKLDAMIVVGGFACSNHIVESIRETFKQYDIPVLRPHNPELAVLRGAVLFGHNEDIITSRIMRFTYGVGMVMKFDKKRNNPEKKYVDENGIEWATDVFRKHVTINDQVETGVWISDKDYFPMDDNQSKATVYVYSSCKKDPDHTTDEGCQYVGNFEITFPRNKAEIEIAMYFSGTEIVIRAKEKKSGNVSYQTLKTI